MNMARTSTSAPKPAKEPGRLKQMYQVFTMTRRHDSTSIYKMLLAFAGPILLGVILGFIFTNGTILGFVLWIVAGVLGGVLAFLIVLGRLAEKAAFSQIEGQPGAVGAVLKSSLRRGWTASEMPVAVSPKTQDAVYRAVGNGGVVLIGEGPKSRTQRMLDEERRRVARVLPNVPVNFMHVGPDADSTPLHKLAGRMNRFKRSLNKAEVYAVSNRLSSLGKNQLPIPKGIDPTKARAPRPR
jgi:F0F1-type ATP synthase assembly protein I